jgi:hypothetical protein
MAPGSGTLLNMRQSKATEALRQCIYYFIAALYLNLVEIKGTF